MANNFELEKEEAIKQIADSVNGYNTAISKVEKFLNMYSNYTKAYYETRLIGVGIPSKYGEYSKIKMVNKFESITFNVADFKAWLIELLEGGINCVEDITEVKRIANSIGKIPLYCDKMPFQLKEVLFEELEKEGIFKEGAKNEFMELLADTISIASFFEKEEVNTMEYYCLLEFDIVNMDAFKYDALAIGTIENALFNIALKLGYNKKELNCIGVIGICHILEYYFGKRYFENRQI